MHLSFLPRSMIYLILKDIILTMLRVSSFLNEQLKVIESKAYRSETQLKKYCDAFIIDECYLTEQTMLHATPKLLLFREVIPSIALAGPARPRPHLLVSAVLHWLESAAQYQWFALEKVLASVLTSVDIADQRHSCCLLGL